MCDDKDNRKTSISKADLIVTMDNLSKIRPLFHSEADFQLALAKQIEKEYACKVRLEYPVYIDCLPFELKSAYTKDKNGNNKTLKSNYKEIGNTIRIRRYLDILVLIDGEVYPIELKYKTAFLHYNDIVTGDEYNLADVSAQNLASYDFWKDVYRIERMKSVIKGFKKGFTIWLTNDLSYTKRNVFDSQYFHFAVCKTKHASGNLKWKKKINGKFSEVDVDFDKDSRQDYIPLNGNYTVSWKEYGGNHPLNNCEGAAKFEYAINEIV